jgi:hypothetical protein
VHAPKEIMATARKHGLEPVLDRPGAFWTVTALRRIA